MATVEETERLRLRGRLFSLLDSKEAVDELARDWGAYLAAHPDDLELRIEGAMLVRLQTAFDQEPEPDVYELLREEERELDELYARRSAAEL